MIALVFISALLLTVVPLQDRAAQQEGEARFTHGVELQQKGDLQGAQREYLAALSLLPRRADVLSNLGVVYARLGHYDKAIENYRDALTIDPNQISIRLNLGIAHFQTGEFDLARTELGRVVAIQATNN